MKYLDSNKAVSIDIARANEHVLQLSFSAMIFFIRYFVFTMSSLQRIYRI